MWALEIAGKAALQCGDRERIGMSGQVCRNHQRRRGQRSAPGLECSEIGSVGARCVFGERLAADKLRNPVAYRFVQLISQSDCEAKDRCMARAHADRAAETDQMRLCN